MVGPSCWSGWYNRAVMRIWRSRLTSCIAIAAGAVLLASCATAFNDPINVQVASDAALMPIGSPPDVGGNTVVALAFSGGGTRAAAFAHGVMRGLDRIPAGRGTYFDKVVFISGVSGGSVAAAYYGLRGRAALGDFRERFLLRNAEEDLDTR